MMRSFILLTLIVILGGCDLNAKRAADAQNQAAEAAEQAAAAKALAETGRQSATGVDEKSESGDVRLSIVDYDGILEHLAANRGKVVVMDAWSTSCPPCMKEFHNLVELHKEYGPDKLACMSLSFDYEGLDKPEEVRPRVLKFIEQQGAAFDNLMSNEESDALYRKFRLAAVPAVFVYDRDGQLRKRFDNEQAKSASEQFTYADVRKLVTEMVREEEAPDPRPQASSP
jgi:thiol-disulfide isomerase/thioredoxin